MHTKQIFFYSGTRSGRQEHIWPREINIFVENLCWQLKILILNVPCLIEYIVCRRPCTMSCMMSAEEEDAHVEGLLRSHCCPCTCCKISAEKCAWFSAMSKQAMIMIFFGTSLPSYCSPRIMHNIPGQTVLSKSHSWSREVHACPQMPVRKPSAQSVQITEVCTLYITSFLQVKNKFFVHN